VVIVIIAYLLEYLLALLAYLRVEKELKESGGIEKVSKLSALSGKILL